MKTCPACRSSLIERYADSKNLRVLAARRPDLRAAGCPACAIQAADSPISPGVIPPPSFGNTGVAGGTQFDSAGNPLPAGGTPANGGGGGLSPGVLDLSTALQIANAARQFVPGLNVPAPAPMPPPAAPPKDKKKASKWLNVRTLEYVLLFGVVSLVLLAVVQYHRRHATPKAA